MSIGAGDGTLDRADVIGDLAIEQPAGLELGERRGDREPRPGPVVAHSERRPAASLPGELTLARLGDGFRLVGKSEPGEGRIGELASAMKKAVRVAVAVVAHAAHGSAVVARATSDCLDNLTGAS